MTDLAKLSKGTVADAKQKLSGLSDDDLFELRRLESSGENRVTLIESIESELDARGLAEPEEERDAGLQAIYNQGRFAAKNGVKAMESPHPAGEKRDAWVEGWKFEKGD